MPTLLSHFFIENPFARDEFSRERKVVYALSQAGLLLALDPDYFAPYIDRLRTEAEALSLALATTGSAISQQMGSTQGVNAALKTVRDVISSKYGLLKDQLGKNSPELHNVFGDRLTTYTTELNLTNYAKRTGTLLLNMQVPANKVTKDTLLAVQKAVAALVAARETQGEHKGTVGVGRTTADEANDTLTDTLFETTGAVTLHYPAKADAAKRHAAYNFALLPVPQSGHHSTLLAGFLPGMGTTALLNPVAPDPLVKVQLCNKGNVRLTFGLSVDGLALAGPGTEVLPGAKLSTTLGALGDPTQEPALLAVNPTSELGQYDVTVG